jgi:hypothetical protein
MWTRNNHNNGIFSYTVWDEKGCVFAANGGFTCHLECEKEAELQNRLALFGTANDDIGDEIAEMSDDELLAALSE